MISIDLADQIDDMLASFGRMKLWETLQQWAALFEDDKPFLFYSLKDQNPNLGQNIEARSRIGNAVIQMKTAHSHEIHVELDQSAALIRKNLSLFRTSDAQLSSLVSPLSILKAFTEAYDVFLKEQDGMKAALVVELASTLNAWHQNMMEEFRAMSGLLRPQPYPLNVDSPRDTFQIRSDVKLDPSELANWILSVVSLHDMVCIILGTEIHQVDLIKLETGSVLGIFGSAAAAISGMKLIFQNALSLYTIPGRRDIGVDNLIAMQKMAGILKKMEKDGVDTDRFKTRIESQIETIMNSMDNILAAEPRLLIDGKWIEPTRVPPNRAARVLPQSEQKKLD